MKEIKRTCEEPLDERQKCAVYKVNCQNTVYVGETWCLFQTRKKEHMDKVRLTNEDLIKETLYRPKNGWAKKMEDKLDTLWNFKVVLTGETQRL